VNFHGIQITDGEEVLRLLRTDPLNPKIPGWFFTRSRWCGCHPHAEHWLDCPMSKVFHETWDAGHDLPDEMGHYWRAPQFGWGEVRYFCYGNPDEPHQLGKINGPTHFCTALGRVVEYPLEAPDDEYDY
jgi:hypothetical protein